MQVIVAVVGLGYVGLPLAVAFGRLYRTVGFDLSESKVDSYRKALDPSGEISSEDLRSSIHLVFTNSAEELAIADYIIVAVPTPVDNAHRPDFSPVRDACRIVGSHMKRGSTVVFESTVYPGATEDICVPEIERHSGLKWKKDFFVGYSPERINPGDRDHILSSIVKIVAGDTPETLENVSHLYESIVQAGIHCASSIKVAEAAKVIENTQRDLNISLMNELSIIFHRMGIDTSEVLAAAGTKWNFLRFTPGLVGGHCIGVDPYYLTHAAEMWGHHPQVILAGRRINDSMGKFIAEQTVKCMAAQSSSINGAKVNVLGLTFKENCADIRNSKVVDLIRELEAYGVRVNVHDPKVKEADARREYGIHLIAWDQLPTADAIVVAVAHDHFRKLPLPELLQKVSPGGCVIDVKSILPRLDIEKRGLKFWRL
jgi:UDP-N-acetyl-D-galactosamine dehydrogenase